MSLLTPLFILGLAGLSLPVVLHLIRRTPRGRQSFGSLMFLTPSPPRLTRRSRLDHLLLLFLRALALALLAIAFARPFMREAASLSLANTRGRKVAILVDTSASMQRGGIWANARGQVEQVIQELEPADDVALLAFDDRVRTLVDFDDGARPQRQVKAAVVREQLSGLAPTWAATDFALALTTTADALAVTEDVNQSDAVLQIVLVSDMPRSAMIDGLESYEWPPEVSVDIRRVAAASQTNATLRILTSDHMSPHAEQVRVRVTNSKASETDQFFLRWASADANAALGDEIALYVPAGQSRVVKVAHPPGPRVADRLVLRGDQCTFDNEYFTVPVPQRQVHVVYFGSDAADDATGAYYYLQLALAETPLSKVTLSGRTGDEVLLPAGSEVPQLIVASEAVAGGQLDALKKYVRAGGTLFLIATGEQSAVQLVSFDQHLRLLDGESDVADDYVMLSEIDFTHPLFAAFDDPQYSDFTKIHFWNHARFAIDEGSAARVVARFDDDSPAFWEQAYGDGRVLVLTSSWRPEESQLARSSKFVPLVLGVLEQATGGAPKLPSYVVNQPVRLSDTIQPQAIVKPDGTRQPLAGEPGYFDSADLPGIYQADSDGVHTAFAVNVAPSESDTTEMDLTQLEQFGVVLGDQPTQSEELERQRQLRDVELEDEQKLWQWLIAAALCVLSLESLLAGRAARKLERGDE